MAGPKVAKKLADVVSEVASKGKGAAEKILANIDTAEKAVALKGPEREAYLKALDEVHGPREQRAKDMGFGEQVYYHGTPHGDFEKFNPAMADRSGWQAFVTDKKNDAKAFAKRGGDEDVVVKELRLRGNTKDPYMTLKEQGVIARDEDGVMRTTAQRPGRGNAFDSKNTWKIVERPDSYKALQDAGINNAKITEEIDWTKKPRQTNNVAVGDASSLRDVKAAFDPRFKDSPLLLAGAAAMPMTMPKEYDPAEVAKSAYDAYDSYVQQPVSKASEYIVNKLIDAQSPDKESAQRLKDSGAAGATKMILEGIADPTNLLAAPLAGGLKLSKRFRQSKEGQAILQKIAKGAAGEGIMFAPGMAQDSKFGVKEIISNQINAQEAVNAQKQALETAKHAVRVDDLHTAAALPTTGLIKPTDVVPKK